jgi:hypothetical protein
MYKSMLPDEESENSFQRLCNNYIFELQAHRKQMELVKEGKADPYPAPTAHPDIVASVIEEEDDWNISYRIEDDTPKPPVKSLDQKRADLVNDVIRIASELQNKIYPVLKLPLLSIKTVQALSVEEEKRTDDQKKIIEVNKDVSDKMNELNATVAQMHSDIADLTEENIDTWKPSFPEIK